MALIRPVLFPINAFDATQEQIVQFSVPVGGDQVTQNRLTIVKQSDGTQVYQNTQTTFGYTHTIPAGTLENGTYYTAYLNTYNATGEVSVNSNTVAFWCYTTPTFAFTNIPVNNIITNSSFNFEVTYNQIENEPLNSYEFILYDSQQIQIANSGVLYPGEVAQLPLIVSYNFGGFTDLSSYYIKATGVTLQGTQISTPLVSFTIRYIVPSVFTLVELSQNCSGGYVTIKSNMTNIEGRSNPDPPKYVDDNTAVDVTGDGEYVNWDEKQFEFSDDFTTSIWGRNFNPNTVIAEFRNNNGDSIVIRYCEGYEQGGDVLKAYADLTVTQGTSIYYIYSQYIDIPQSTDKIQFWIRRIDNYYQIDIYNLS